MFLILMIRLKLQKYIFFKASAASISHRRAYASTFLFGRAGAQEPTLPSVAETPFADQRWETLDPPAAPERFPTSGFAPEGAEWENEAHFPTELLSLPGHYFIALSSVFIVSSHVPPQLLTTNC